MSRSTIGMQRIGERRKMKIILAKHAGFCFGVRRAVEITKETAKKVYNESAGVGMGAEKPRVFTYGELIHNKTVVEELASEGITAIASPEEAQAGDYVVIRSHGVPASVYQTDCLHRRVHKFLSWLHLYARLLHGSTMSKG